MRFSSRPGELTGPLALAVALAAGSSAPARAQPGASAQGQAGAAIVQPITVHALEDLAFGTVAVGRGESGAITVDPASATTTYSGALRGLCGTGGCSAHPALFGVVGEPGRRYRIAAPATAEARPQAGDGPALPISAITVAVKGEAAGSVRGMLDSHGRDRFRIGGTLAVASGTAAGFYRADLRVVVSYD